MACQLQRVVRRVTHHRVDSQRGYTMDNVMVVCLIYNLAKSDGTAADVEELARAMVAKLDGE